MPKLVLFWLGAPRILYEGRPVELDRHKSLALLAYLALSGQPHRRDALAALLWPDLDQRRARAGLRRVLFSLQAALPGDWWDVGRETVSLRPSAELWTDAAQFSRLLASRRQHGHAPSSTCPACVDPLTEAVELYHDDLLAGFSLRDCPAFDNWQLTLAENLREELAQALNFLVQWHAAQSDFELAIRYARRWLALDVLSEPVHQHLMRLYAWSGQRAAALRQFADCEHLLEAELGIEPRTETRALYQDIKDNLIVPPLIVVSPTTRPLPDMGHTGVSTPTAPSLGPTSRPRLLRSPMVGRAAEWALAAGMWEQAQNGAGQVLLVSGEPGIGKSRFARELAAWVQHGGGQVLSSECYTEGGAPYYPLAHLIRQGLDLPQAARLPAYLLADLLLLAPQLQARFPDIVQAGPSEETDFERLRLRDSFVTWCEGLTQTTPLLVIVEDVHWADRGTLVLLQDLARRIQQTALLVVLTFRDTEIEQAHARGLEGIFQDLLRERQAVALRLPRLDHAATGALLGGLLSTGEVSAVFVESIFRETEGNPFFVEETCQALIDEGKMYTAGGVWRRQDLAQLVLPRSVRAAILARVERLPGAVQAALRLAAVIGRTFDLDLLKAAGAQTEAELLSALETAEHRQLVSAVPRGDSLVFVFAHALIPFALRESLGHARLRQAHGQVAEALEATRPDDLETLAYHYAAGGQRSKAIAYLRRAGERAALVYSYDDAVKYLDQALSLLEAEAPNSPRLAVMERLAELHDLRGVRVEAMRLYQAVLDLLENPGHWDKWAFVRLQRKMGETMLRMQQVEMAPFAAGVRAGMERARALSDNEPPHLETARLLTTMAMDVYWESVMADNQVVRAELTATQGHLEAWDAAVAQSIQIKRQQHTEAEPLARAAIAIAEQLDDPEVLSEALGALLTDFSNRQMYRECLELSMRRLALSRDPRFVDTRERIGILLGAGGSLMEFAHHKQALPYLLEAEALAIQIGDVSMQINALGVQGSCYFDMDRWDEMLAIEDKRRVLEGVNLSRTSRMCFYCGLTANVLGFRGEYDLARQRRESSAQHMIDVIGPIETWPAIGHY